MGEEFNRDMTEGPMALSERYAHHRELREEGRQQERAALAALREACAANPADASNVDDRIDEWHRTRSMLSLHEFLGWTWEQFTAWAKAPGQEALTQTDQAQEPGASRETCPTCGGTRHVREIHFQNDGHGGREKGRTEYVPCPDCRPPTQPEDERLTALRAKYDSVEVHDEANGVEIHCQDATDINGDGGRSDTFEGDTPDDALRDASPPTQPEGISMSDESFSFSHEDDGSLSLESAVFQALGAASMCWEGKPTGVFESDRAKAIGDALLERIRNHFDTTRPDPQPPVEGDRHIAAFQYASEILNDEGLAALMRSGYVNFMAWYERANSGMAGVNESELVAAAQPVEGEGPRFTENKEHGHAIDDNLTGETYDPADPDEFADLLLTLNEFATQGRESVRPVAGPYKAGDSLVRFAESLWGECVAVKSWADPGDTGGQKSVYRRDDGTITTVVVEHFPVGEPVDMSCWAHVATDSETHMPTEFDDATLEELSTLDIHVERMWISPGPLTTPPSGGDHA